VIRAMSFAGWLRSNSEHYLLQDAQRRMAERYDANPPLRPHGLKERFWRQVFVPVYRLLPWRLRQRTIQAMPGSHRRDWPKPDYRRRQPGI
jgi:hypothetical protein